MSFRAELIWISSKPNLSQVGERLSMKLLNITAGSWSALSLPSNNVPENISIFKVNDYGGYDSISYSILWRYYLTYN